jgi:hypothetical protein
VLALCLMLIYSCSKYKPLETYNSNVVWFAKFQHTHGASDPMKQVPNPKGLFIIKHFDKKFEVKNGDTVYDLTIDSLKSYANSTRFFLKDQRHKLFQISILADSVQLKRGEARIEFLSWSTPYYSKFMDWNPTYTYAIDAVKQ